MRKFKVKNLSIDENGILTYNSNRIFLSNIIFNQKFEILVKPLDEVKRGQVILARDNQKILSPFCGKVLSIKLDKNIENELVYYIEIEKNNKNDEIYFEKPNVLNKDELINMCENFGILSENNFASILLKKMNCNLLINAYDLPFVFNNKLLLEKEENVLKNCLEKLVKICTYKKVIFYTNKSKKNAINNLSKTFLNHLDYKPKIVIKTKQCKSGLMLCDLVNIFNAFNGYFQDKKLITINGGALNKNSVVKTEFGTPINSLINFTGSFKQNIEEIEDYKYMALVAFNDENILREKIKKEKNPESKQKLEKMLKEKQNEANKNIFSKLEEYHQKILNCLSVCLINGKKSNIQTKNFELPIDYEFFGIHFLSFNEFR